MNNQSHKNSVYSTLPCTTTKSKQNVSFLSMSPNHVDKNLKYLTHPILIIINYNNDA